MGNRAQKSHSDARWRRTDLREGFTTGSCATAAARAATRALLTRQPVKEITIDLPVREAVTFAVARCERTCDGVRCGVIKDAGDDPDVTDGAELQASVSWQDEPGITLAGGAGVGRVTLPGLPVPVGEPAINPVPRRLIVRSVTEEAGDRLNGRGLKVTISVPGGEALARETLNPKLGILGGISILGTTGIVKPFSTSAYRASIYVELKLARTNGVEVPVLTTGSRSEAYAQKRYPQKPAFGYVQAGDHIDYGLRQCRRLNRQHPDDGRFREVVISGMIGKVSKLAQGRMQTHVSHGEVDLDFLAELASARGAPVALADRIRAANTAHHVQVMLREVGIAGLEAGLAQMAAEAAAAYVGGAFPVTVLLWHIQGELLAVGSAPGGEE